MSMFVCLEMMKTLVGHSQDPQDRFTQIKYREIDIDIYIFIL